MKIQTYIILTDKRALAQVVYLDPDRPGHNGIVLEKPENIWGSLFYLTLAEENDSEVNTL